MENRKKLLGKNLTFTPFMLLFLHYFIIKSFGPIIKKGGNMAKASKPKEQEILVVASKVREYIKGNECLTASDVIEALSRKVYSSIDDAITRAKANGRKTVTAKDI